MTPLGFDMSWAEPPAAAPLEGGRGPLSSLVQAGEVVPEAGLVTALSSALQGFVAGHGVLQSPFGGREPNVDGDVPSEPEGEEEERLE